MRAGRTTTGRLANSSRILLQILSTIPKRAVHRVRNDGARRHMTHPIFHAQSSVRRFGGKVDDYRSIHDWLDGTKKMFADFRHRALRHHS